MGTTDLRAKFLDKKEQISKLRKQLFPNSWGRQQYEGSYYDTVYQEKIDLKNIAAKKGWIQAYVKMHFEGIKSKLRKNHSNYTTQNLSYKKTDIA